MHKYPKLKKKKFVLEGRKISLSSVLKGCSKQSKKIRREIAKIEKDLK